MLFFNDIYLGVQSLYVRPQILEVGPEWMDMEEGRYNACGEEGPLDKPTVQCNENMSMGAI